MEKILNYSLWGMMGLSVVFMAILFGGGGENPDIIMFWCYFLIGVAGMAAIGFPIYRMKTDFNDSKNTLISFGVLKVIFWGCYALANSDASAYSEYLNDDDGYIVQITGAALGLFYVIFATAIGATIYSAINSMRN